MLRRVHPTKQQERITVASAVVQHKLIFHMRKSRSTGNLRNMYQRPSPMYLHNLLPQGSSVEEKAEGSQSTLPDSACQKGSRHSVRVSFSIQSLRSRAATVRQICNALLALLVRSRTAPSSRTSSPHWDKASNMVQHFQHRPTQVLRVYGTQRCIKLIHL